MHFSGKNIIRFDVLHGVLLGAAILWTSLVGVVFFWNLKQIEKSAEELARIAAQASIEKDMLYRQWVVRHGGVYVPVSDSIPKNPLLAGLSGRDAKTSDGVDLTMVTASALMRQAHSLAIEPLKKRGRITSLKSVSNEGSPDPWEREALLALQKGAREVSGHGSVNGIDCLRLMRPLKVDDSCVRCHAPEGYKVGDVAGGISVSVALDDFQGIRQRHEKYEALKDCSMWVVGLVAIGFSGRLLSRQQTERERSKEALRRSEERFRALFEDSPIAIWLEDFSEVLKCVEGWRAAGIVNLREYMTSRPEEVFALAARVHVVEVNQASVQVFGARDKSEVFRELPRYFTPDSLSVFREEVCALVEGKSAFSGEVPLRNVQGVPVVFEITLSVQPGHEKTLDRVIISFVDITQRLRTEEHLRRERDRVQTCLDTVESIILGVSPDGRIMFINKKGCRILERSEEELVGQNWFELCIPDGAERQLHWEQYSKHVGEADPRFEYVENSIVTKSGARRRIVWHNALLRDQAGKVIGTLSSGDDITERRVLEERLRDAQKMEAIGQLAGGVAHDFNNILSATMLNLDLLQQQPHLTEDMRDMLSELHKETQRAAEITRQLLMFSRRSVFEYKVIDINELTTRVVGMLSRLLGERISIDVERRTAAAFVEADADMITQVIMNICINARDAMPRGGRISIVTDVTEVDATKTHLNPDRHPGTFVRISLSDNGMGMDETVVSRIFEPFFTTKEFGKGSGLGLAAVYGIVAQHGGWVEVESRLGKGTTFRVLLPMMVPRPDKTAEAPFRLA